MDADVTVEYVAAPLDVLGMDASAPDFHEFQRIFEKFTAVEGEVEEDAVVASGGAAAGEDADGMEVDAVEKEAAALEQSDDEEEVTDAQQKPSGKKKNRLSVAQLKQLVDRPDVVEVGQLWRRETGFP